MTKRRKSDHVSDTYASDMHRNLGTRCYYADADGIEYGYDNGKVVFHSIMENKYGKIENLNLQESSITMLKALADILSVPLFLVITFMDPKFFNVPMYYVHPLNAKAEQPNLGWLTVKQYSVFLHKVHGIQWNYLEWIAELQCTLGQLPNQYKEYPLPEGLPCLNLPTKKLMSKI